MFRDFLLFYQINLIDVLAGRDDRFTPPILLSLIERFPEGSEFGAEKAGNRQLRDWRQDTYLLANIANNVNVNTMVTGNVPLSKRKQFHMIEPPKVTDGSGPKKRRTTIADIAAALAPKF